MTCISLDLTVREAMADPVIAAAMRADHVDPQRLEAMLRSTARDLFPAREIEAGEPSLAALCHATRTGCAGSARPW